MNFTLTRRDFRRIINSNQYSSVMLVCDEFGKMLCDYAIADEMTPSLYISSGNKKISLLGLNSIMYSEDAEGSSIMFEYGYDKRYAKLCIGK